MTDQAHLTRVPGTNTNPAVRRAAGGDSLADILERVLDKGVVVAGDIGISVLDIELLTLKVRLLIASADTAREMGIDWWESDPFLSSRAREKDDETKELRRRVADLERRLGDGSEGSERPAGADGSDEPGETGS